MNRFQKLSLIAAGAILLAGCTPAQPTLEDAMVACIEVYATEYPDNAGDLCAELTLTLGEEKFVTAFTDEQTRDAIERGLLG